MTTYSILPNAKIIKRRNARTAVPVAFHGAKGDGRISGTVRHLNNPVSGYIVQLFHPESGRLLDTTTTTIDGTYSFEGLDHTQLFDVIAFDPENVWEKKISSRRSPQHMPNIRSVDFRSDANFSVVFTPAPEAVDIYFDDVIALAPLSSDFSDIKGNTWTVAGDPSISDENQLFGEDTVYLNGSGDYLRCDAVSVALAGETSWTIEGWFSKLAHGPEEAFLFAFNNNSTNIILLGEGSVYPQGSKIDLPGWIFKDSGWYHIAMSVDEGMMTVYVNGEPIIAQMPTSLIGSTNQFSVGQEFDGLTNPSNFFNGFVSNVRVTKGVARYKNGFTPPDGPFQTEPL